MFPALFLYPLEDSFKIPKRLVLSGEQRVVIGRQCNAGTIPTDDNGYFDTKVLSRRHAEVWAREETGKIFIKDTKSMNGTFVNRERLSPAEEESVPYELKTGDIIVIGIDVFGNDKETIDHHKVTARVYSVFSDTDADAAARSESSQETT